MSEIHQYQEIVTILQQITNSFLKLAEITFNFNLCFSNTSDII